MVVEQAIRSIDLAATHQAALVLCGDGDLVQVARGVHRHALGDEKRFVLCDPRRRTTDVSAQLASRPTGADALAAAIGGTVCVRAKRLRRDFAEIVAAVHDARIRLVICGVEPPRLTELVLAPIKIPALATRTHELDRIIDEYADEARVALQISTPLKDADRHLVRVRCREWPDFGNESEPFGRLTASTAFKVAEFRMVRPILAITLATSRPITLAAVGIFPATSCSIRGTGR